MESQQHPLDLSTLARGLPAPPSSAEQNKVVASLSIVPPELKLKIAEEAYEMPYEETEQAQGNSRVRSQKCGGAEALSRVNKEFHKLCKPLRWKHVDLALVSPRPLDRFLRTVFRKHSALIQEYTVNRTGRIPWESLADTAEALEIKMTGNSSRMGPAPDRSALGFFSELGGHDSEGILLAFLLRTTPNLRKLTGCGTCGFSVLLQALDMRVPPPLRSISMDVGERNAQSILDLLRRQKLLSEIQLRSNIEYFSNNNALEDFNKRLWSTLSFLPDLVSLSLLGIPLKTSFAEPDMPFPPLKFLHIAPFFPDGLSIILPLVASSLVHLSVAAFSMAPSDPPSLSTSLPRLRRLTLFADSDVGRTLSFFGHCTLGTLNLRSLSVGGPATDLRSAICNCLISFKHITFTILWRPRDGDFETWRADLDALESACEGRGIEFELVLPKGIEQC